LDVVEYDELDGDGGGLLVVAPLAIFVVPQLGFCTMLEWMK
jgi:hypothetical protein